VPSTDDCRSARHDFMSKVAWVFGDGPSSISRGEHRPRVEDEFRGLFFSGVVPVIVFLLVFNLAGLKGVIIVVLALPVLVIGIYVSMLVICREPKPPERTELEPTPSLLTEDPPGTTVVAPDGSVFNVLAHNGVIRVSRNGITCVWHVPGRTESTFSSPRGTFVNRLTIDRAPDAGSSQN
jgi:hypothetical protein